MTLDQVLRETDVVAARKFVDNHINEAMSRLPDIFMPDGQLHPKYNLMKSQLEQMLSRAYVDMAAPYYSSKGLMQRFTAPVLRGLGFGFDALGTYAFWALGGYGFGLKAIGFMGKTVADLINGWHYARHSGLNKELGIAAVQTVLDHSLAYLPLGVTELRDFYCGVYRNKWDIQTDNRVLDYVADRFRLVYGAGEPAEPRIMPLSELKLAPSAVTV